LVFLEPVSRCNQECRALALASQKRTRLLTRDGGFAGRHAAIHLDDTLARDPDIEITPVTTQRLLERRSSVGEKHSIMPEVL